MSHVDSPYSFARGLQKPWIVLRDVIGGEFLQDGVPQILHSGGLRKSGKKPNLNDLMLETLDSIDVKTVNLMDKYSKLNSVLFDRLSELRGRDIIFTDPVSPNKLDPRFLFSYLKHLGVDFPEFMVDWYQSGSVGRVWHDPYSPVFAQSDAVLLMAAVNPGAWNDKIIWPVSFVPFPSVVGDGLLQYVFPDSFQSIDGAERSAGRVGFGSSSRALHVPFSDFSPQVGTFYCDSSSFDAAGLEDLLDSNPMCFESRLNQLMATMSSEGAKEFIREEIRYDVMLKREMSARFYAMILRNLGVNPVLFAGKNSLSFDLLSRATKILGREGVKLSVDLIGPDGSGPLDSGKKSFFSYLDSSALERLNGRVVIPYSIESGVEPVNVVSFLPKSSGGLRLKPCLYAPVWCEAVYDEILSCARDEGEVQACSRDLFDLLKNPDWGEEFGVGKGWIEQFNESNPPVHDVAELVDRTCSRDHFIFYSAEHVAWLLNKGPNYEVFTSADYLDGKKLDSSDERRRKGRLSWHAERGCDVIFPFKHESKPGVNPLGRISSLALPCDLARLIAMHSELPPYVPASEAAVRGTAGHFLTNGSLEGKPLLQELLWRGLGVKSTWRRDYTETEIHLSVDGEVLSGHSDCVLLKAPEFSDSPSVADLVIVDYKTAVARSQPPVKYVRQLGAYALAYAQLFPEISFKNFYLVLECRPMVSDFAEGLFPQRISIVKVENNDGDLLLKHIKEELSTTVDTQRGLLESSDLLNDYKNNMSERGYCDAGKKPGCFSDQRAKCEAMFSNLKGESMKEYVSRCRT